MGRSEVRGTVSILTEGTLQLVSKHIHQLRLILLLWVTVFLLFVFLSILTHLISLFLALCISLGRPDLVPAKLLVFVDIVPPPQVVSCVCLVPCVCVCGGEQTSVCMFLIALSHIHV